MKVNKAKDHVAFWSSGHAEPNITERSYKYSDRRSHILYLSRKLTSSVLAIYGHCGCFNANGGGEKKKGKKKK